MNLHDDDARLVSLSPINCFQLVHNAPRVTGNTLPPIDTKEGKRYLLPITCSLCYEEPFAKVAIGWNSDGIAVTVEVGQPMQEVVYPDVTRGDSVELFIDTRDIKSSGFNTRFCHHFYFLPDSIDGHRAAEVTHFRTDDAHELCAPQLLEVTTQKGRESYTMHIFIPSQCLNGYDPEQCGRLGISYRINRPDGPQQHFSADSAEYHLEQQPVLWSSVQLTR